MFSKASLEMKPSTELSEFNLLNSELDTDMMLDNLCLTVEMLKVHSGSEHLDDVKSLEIWIHLPKLTDLKMNNSFISSIRDLGTSLSHLQILRLARCSLTDLEGISALTSLKELYVAYNSISELSPVSMLENLELLDLEGNDVEDLAQLWYLGCCGKLRALSMEGNPVCTNPAPGQSESSDYSFRSAVRELVPQLSFLDDVPVEEDKPHDGRTSLLDWTILKESIKDSSVSERLHAIDTDTEVRSVVCGARPSSAQSMDLRKTFNSPSNSRPHTSCGGSRPGSAGSELPMLNHETMDLTIAWRQMEAISTEKSAQTNNALQNRSNHELF
ncbi:hypothetical protein DNTS_028378 [Danionella cerebrum]|uniref:Leucine rich repeat containing 56 n=1 Tax=Danionella cerebrum TaxID=2873325 RepID=A0A553MSW3_9TELE|nr:hypothetical protein DNTS_028378 [Danionella translucida]